MHLIFGIGVVSVHRSKEMVAFSEGTDIGAISGSKSHGQSVQRIELVPNRFMEKQENQNWRFRKGGAIESAAGTAATAIGGRRRGR